MMHQSLYDYKNNVDEFSEFIMAAWNLVLAAATFVDLHAVPRSDPKKLCGCYSVHNNLFRTWQMSIIFCQQIIDFVKCHI